MSRRTGVLAELRRMHPLDRRALIASTAAATIGLLTLAALVAGAATLI